MLFVSFEMLIKYANRIHYETHDLDMGKCVYERSRLLVYVRVCVCVFECSTTRVSRATMCRWNSEARENERESPAT